ncbi:MAG: HD domain-containing protein, partial [Spirochaetaceae bacterium]|nr:HD domain-containing protein [Spirochaetaceae bacterium]
MNKIQEAIIFATLAHEGQKRKGTDIPYIVHPMEVMQILTECHCNDDVIIAGILHDTLEDTKTVPADIEKKFGSAVLKLVQSESEDKSKTWKERKQNTIDELKTASAETRIICF